MLRVDEDKDCLATVKGDLFNPLVWSRILERAEAEAERRKLVTEYAVSWL